MDELRAALSKLLGLIENGTLTVAADWPECAGDNSETVAEAVREAEKALAKTAGVIGE